MTKKQEFLDQFVATAVGQSILGQPPRHMQIYAVITDDLNGTGAVNILAIGKPKFKVNDFAGQFFTPAFTIIHSLEKTPFSSDLIGLSLYSPNWMVHSFYEKLKKMSQNNMMPMSLIEQSIFNKLQQKYGSNDIITTVSNDGYMDDIALMESIFIHEERFNASFEKLKKF